MAIDTFDTVGRNKKAIKEYIKNQIKLELIYLREVYFMEEF